MKNSFGELIPIFGTWREGPNRVEGFCPKGCESKKKNPSYEVLIENGTATRSYCFKCDGLFSGMYEDGFIEYADDVPDDEDTQQKIHDVQDYYSEVEDNRETSESKKIFRSRGIKEEYADELKIYDSKDSTCIIPFFTRKGFLVALNYRKNFDGQSKKLYKGPKGLGQGIVKEGRYLIVSEGLFNGLSVYQTFREAGLDDLGLIISGDANNLRKLAGEHSWAVKKARKIFVAADFDRSCAGQSAAYEIARKFPKKTMILLPRKLGADWNDYLMEGTIKNYL